MEVNITIEGSGLNFNGKTDLAKAAYIIGFLTKPDTSLPNPTEGTRIITPSSPRQALILTRASSNDEKIAVFINYYSVRNNVKELSAKEILLGFEKSGEPRPKNLARDLIKAVQRGYVMKSEDSKGAYALTDLGEELIKKGFNQ
jgi:hypothetical protein